MLLSVAVNNSVSPGGPACNCNTHVRHCEKNADVVWIMTWRFFFQSFGNHELALNDRFIVPVISYLLYLNRGKCELGGDCFQQQINTHLVLL